MSHSHGFVDSRMRPGYWTKERYHHPHHQHQIQQQQQQQKQQQQPHHRTYNGKKNFHQGAVGSSTFDNGFLDNQVVRSDFESGNEMAGAIERTDHANLENFVRMTTPAVPAQSVSKYDLLEEESQAASVYSGDSEHVPFFFLGDVWDCFEEWSVYGLGVPMRCGDDESAIQYFVPYLSGIQLYSRTGMRQDAERRRHGGGSCDFDLLDSCSDSSDSDLERHFEGNFLHGRSRASSETSSESGSSRCYYEDMRAWGFFDLGEHTGVDDTSSVEDERDFTSPPWDCCMDCDHGSLMFQYFEHTQPFMRVPLADKITELEAEFKELRSVRSIDLHPRSWFSVSWYPIYRIPGGVNLKDAGACFLTYHSLSSTVPGAYSDCQKCQTEFWIASSCQVPQLKYESSTPHGSSNFLSSTLYSELPTFELELPAFGLASYKARGSSWLSLADDRKKMASMSNSAATWLKQLNVRHPDFEFFSHR